MNDYSATKDIVDKATQGVVESTSQGIDVISLTLIIVISVNIAVEVFKFVGMLVLSNRDKNNKRKLLIEEKSIRVLEQLFQMLDALAMHDKSSTHQMLTDVQDITQFVAKNKLYISKKFQKCTNETLDYFKEVMVDFKKKSIEKENKLFDKFCNEFNK